MARALGRLDAEGRVAAGAARVRLVIAHLHRLGQGEEGLEGTVGAVDQRGRYAVAADPAEAELAIGRAQLGYKGLSVGLGAADVERRNMRAHAAAPLGCEAAAPLLRGPKTKRPCRERRGCGKTILSETAIGDSENALNRRTGRATAALSGAPGPARPYFDRRPRRAGQPGCARTCRTRAAPRPGARPARARAPGPASAPRGRTARESRGPGPSRSRSADRRRSPGSEPGRGRPALR